MRVLMQSRSNFYTLRGGDTMQLEKTKAELEKIGVEVDISLEYAPDLSKYDIVHLSNITRVHETYLQMQNAVEQNKPIVLSTIFWPMEEFEQTGQIGIRKILNKHLHIDNIERIKTVARIAKDKSARNIASKNLISVGYTKMQNYVVEHTDVFLPNAEEEMRQIETTFHIQNRDYVVVPNGIDENIAKEKLTSNIPKKFWVYKDAIICVGRIETRKNQLGLVKALDGSGLKLVLVGAVSGNQISYYKEIRQYINKNPNFTHIEQMSNDELYLLYKICKVNALPSWLDTPGLVNLEAAAMGCNLAISPRGTTREYFKDKAFYCEPDDISGIKKAIMKAYEAPKNTELQKMVFENYTWERAAKATIRGYERALQKRK